MFNKIKVKLFLLFIFFFQQISYAAEIPVIVIAPGKTAQSLNTVGSSVTVIDGETIRTSSHYSLAEIIAESSVSTNMFQMGGHGTNTGIQLRGLEKRYSTVYIDGVKMLDPSASDGSFYMESIMKSSIDRVEILRGTQSSLYGSNAIGGTIHIFTKKGKEGNNQNFEIENGSNNTKNLSYSIDGAGDKFQYYLGFNTLTTHGISAMNNDDEDDEYRNDGIIGNMGYRINDNLKLENSFRLTDSFLEYDTVSSSGADNDHTDNLEGSYTLKLIHEKNKFKNSLIFNKFHIERNTENSSAVRSNYFGYRDSINYLGEYNFNLDNKIVYGIGAELDESRYDISWTTVKNRVHNENTISQYFDYQFRPLQNLYSTIGFRNDNHSTVGSSNSGRVTLAYQLDGNSKIRSSLGTGVRFPALYDYKYGSTTIVDKGGVLEDLKSERGNSFDIGYDTYLANLDLGLSATLFKTEQKNSLVSKARTEWVVKNGAGTNTSEGLELSAMWKPVDKKTSLNFNYTFTDSYDADSCDPYNQLYVDQECRHIGSKVEAYKVRVPRHTFNSKINYDINKNFRSSIKASYRGETRDYGNTNNSWTDVILDDYFLFDFEASYKYANGYKLNFSIANILDQEYEQAYQYSSMGRDIHLGITRAF